MKNLAFTASEFHRNVAGTKHRSKMSLRSTKTSEISNYVKNCNLAETYHLKKELNIWHKDTRFNVRRFERKTEDMYKSLLQLSKDIKTIKSVRQEEKKDKAEQRVWRKSYRRTHRRANIVTKSLRLAAVDEEKRESPYLKGDGTYVNNQGNTRNEMSSFCELQSDKEDKNGTRQAQTKRIRQQKIKTSWEKNFYDTYNEVLTANQIPMLKKGKRKLSSSNLKSSTCAALQNDLKSLTSEETFVQSENQPQEQAFNSIRECKIDEEHAENVIGLSDPDSTHDIENNQLNDFQSRRGLNEISDCIDDTRMPAVSLLNSEEVIDARCLPNHSDSIDINILPGNLLNRSLSRVVDNPLMPYSMCCSENHFQKKWKFKKNKFDPSHKLNTSSSIQARPGKIYNVSVYKKNTEGNLEKEEVLWDTTVDVYKHFNIASFRDRFKRKELLTEAQNIEAVQRHRVDQFLKKLSRDMKLEAVAEKKRHDQNDDDMEELKRRLEARRKGPPKYGLNGNGDAPNYVRNYIKPSKSNNFGRNHGSLKKRSSWALPSLFTLQLAGVSKSPLSLLNSSFYDQSGPGLFPGSSSSHLVNINVEKYTKEEMNTTVG